MDRGAVEICDLPVVSMKQDDAGDAIVDACKSHGFFVLQDHDITLIEELFAQSKAFFDLPRDTKNTIKAAATLRGYSAPGAEVLDPENQTGFESKEAFDVRTHSEEPTARPLSGPNVFPSEELVPGFKACMNQYFADMLQLGRQVAALLAEGLHLHAGAFNAHMFGASSMSALKLLKYPAEKSDAAKGILGT
eukprot:6944-Heterococcus_DN1.PRE.1